MTVHDDVDILETLRSVHPEHPQPQLCHACEVLGRWPEPEPYDPILEGARDWVHCGRCTLFCQNRDSHTRRAHEMIKWFRKMLVDR